MAMLRASSRSRTSQSICPAFSVSVWTFELYISDLSEASLEKCLQSTNQCVSIKYIFSYVVSVSCIELGTVVVAGVNRRFSFHALSTLTHNSSHYAVETFADAFSTATGLGGKAEYRSSPPSSHSLAWC